MAGWQAESDRPGVQWRRISSAATTTKSSVDHLSRTTTLFCHFEVPKTRCRSRHSKKFNSVKKSLNKGRIGSSKAGRTKEKMLMYVFEYSCVYVQHQSHSRTIAHYLLLLLLLPLVYTDGKRPSVVSSFSALEADE